MPAPEVSLRRRAHAGCPLAVAVLLAIGAVPARPQEVPRVHLEPETRDFLRHDGGDRVLRAQDLEGRWWYFKRVGAGQRGHLTAELLAPRLLLRAGVQSPQARLVEVAGMDGRFLQIEPADHGFADSPARVLDADQLPARWQRRVDTGQLRTLQLADAVMANADRHGGNLFGAREGHRYWPRGGDRLRVVGIDHDLAMLGPEAMPADPAMRSWERRFYGLTPDLGPAGTLDTLIAQQGGLGSPAHMMAANQLYRDSLAAARADPHQMLDYVRRAEHLRSALSDHVLRAELARLEPHELGPGDPVVRRQELFERLRSRRDQLPDWMRQVALTTPHAQAAQARAARVVPGGLEGLGLSPRGRLHLVHTVFARDLPLGPGEPVEELYRRLRTAGVAPAPARDLTRQLAAGAGRPVEASRLVAAEADLTPATLRRRRDRLDGPSRGPTAGATQAAGRSFVEVHRTPAGVRARGPGGAPLGPRARAEAARVLEAHEARAGALAPGERLRAVHDPFATSAQARGMHLEVVDAAGRIRPLEPLRLEGLGRSPRPLASPARQVGHELAEGLGLGRPHADPRLPGFDDLAGPGPTRAAPAVPGGPAPPRTHATPTSPEPRLAAARPRVPVRLRPRLEPHARTRFLPRLRLRGLRF